MSNTVAVERLQIAVNRGRAALPFSTRRPVRVVGAAPLYEIHVDGRTVFAPAIRRWRLYRDGFEARLTSVACRYGLDRPLHPGDDDWAVDVGAYMGEWTLYMLRRGWNVLAIEPDPLAALSLKRNMETHAPAGANWVLDERVCVDDASDTVSFYSEPANANSSMFRPDKIPGKLISRPASRLDVIVAEHIPGGRVRILKMDAEGAEPEVLKGAPKVLAGTLRIGIDTGPERSGARTDRECRKILSDAGFILSDELSRDIVTARRE